MIISRIAWKVESHPYPPHYINPIFMKKNTWKFGKKQFTIRQIKSNNFTKFERFIPMKICLYYSAAYILSMSYLSNQMVSYLEHFPLLFSKT